MRKSSSTKVFDGSRHYLSLEIVGHATVGHGAVRARGGFSTHCGPRIARRLQSKNVKNE